MALIKSVRGFTPSWGDECYFADNATLVGDIVLGDQCSVWFNTVLRGDVNSIRVGHRVNIQDGAVIHCTFQQSTTIIGNDVSIGHNAIIHGCTIADQVLVGMGATIMDHAVVEERVLIAAGAVVLEGMSCTSGYIYAGVPAKRLKPLSEDNFAQYIERISKNYIMYARWFDE